MRNQRIWDIASGDLIVSLQGDDNCCGISLNSTEDKLVAEYPREDKHNKIIVWDVKRLTLISKESLLDFFWQVLK